jgi:hypothetical protein
VPAQKPVKKPAEAWINSKVSPDSTNKPEGHLVVNDKDYADYQNPEPVQNPAPEDKGLDMSGFSLAGLGSNSSLDRVPQHLRSTGGYQPGPTQLKEVDMNSLF